MDQVKKAFAFLGGLGALALALWLATFIFIFLVIIGGALALYWRFKLGRAIKTHEREQARRDPGIIEGEYVVVEETLDPERQPRR